MSKLKDIKIYFIIASISLLYVILYHYEFNKNIYYFDLRYTWWETFVAIPLLYFTTPIVIGYFLKKKVTINAKLFTINVLLMISLLTFLFITISAIIFSAGYSQLFKTVLNNGFGLSMVLLVSTYREIFIILGIISSVGINNTEKKRYQY